MQMVDVAPTIATLLGTSIPASNEGEPLTSWLTVSNERNLQILSTLHKQQDALASAYEKAIGVPGQSNADIPAAFLRIAVARDTREANERLSRIIVSIIIAVIGLGVLIWKRSRDMAMLIVGAVVYVVAYNLIFAVITGNVYSMSTVPPTSATDFIIEIAEFTLVAVMLAWPAAMVLTGALRRGALLAAQATYGFALITIYLLFLPVLLGFAINGATTTWRLPDPLLSFLHFTNLMQVVFVAVLSIVLSGVAALVGWRLKPGAKS
jgi:hypothetical protein